MLIPNSVSFALIIVAIDRRLPEVADYSTIGYLVETRNRAVINHERVLRERSTSPVYWDQENDAPDEQWQY